MVIALPPEILSYGKRLFLHDVNFYFWDELFLYGQYANQLMRRCIPKRDVEQILYYCHVSQYGGNYRGYRMVPKVQQSRFYWPTLFKDNHALVKKCD